MISRSDITLMKKYVKHRNAMRRAIFFSRLAILAIAIVFLLTFMRNKAAKKTVSTDHIANVKIFGPIMHIESRIKEIIKIKENKNVKAVVLNVDSPGGAPYASEAIYRALASLAKEKPLVAVIDSMAASGGYFILLPSERIYGRATSIAGSIGAISIYLDYSELLSKLGIKANILRTSPMKAVPQPYEKLGYTEKNKLSALLSDIGNEFCSLVKESRYSEKECNVCNGEIYTGRKALDLGLIDEIGGIEEAEAWLKEKYKIGDKLKIEDYNLLCEEERDPPFFGKIFNKVVDITRNFIYSTYML